MSHRSYGKRATRCPARLDNSGLQCSEDVGHLGRHHNAISGAAWDDAPVEEPEPKEEPKRGNCYVATEALWHILGGAEGPWDVYRLKLPSGETHWFLWHEDGPILDPSRAQFGGTLPNYSTATRAWFLTKQPSVRARMMMDILTWQTEATGIVHAKKSTGGKRGTRR